MKIIKSTLLFFIVLAFGCQENDTQELNVSGEQLLEDQSFIDKKKVRTVKTGKSDDKEHSNE